MSWNPFKKKVKPETFAEKFDREHDAAIARIEQEAARAKAEWDALPSHRKAARIEYRALQGLRYGRIVPEPVLFRFGEQTIECVNPAAWNAK